MDEEELYLGPERRRSHASRLTANEAAIAEAVARAAAIEKDRAEAVARAIRDTNVERDLRDHGAHLREINGSQEQAVKSLASLETTQAAIVATLELARTQAAADIERQKEFASKRVSRRAFLVAVFAAIAGYLSIIVAILTQIH